MKFRIALLLAILFFLVNSCRKIAGYSDVSIQIIDLETGSPIGGAKVILAALSIDNKSNQVPRSLIMAPADSKGNYDARITKSTLASAESVDSYLFFYLDDPNYALEKVLIPSGTKVKTTVKLIRCAEIDLHYHHINANTKVDSFAVGIKFPTEDYFYLDISTDLDKYYRSNNLFYYSNQQITSDTTVRIKCNPLTTHEYFYRIPGKTIHEAVSLKSKEVKSIDINY